MTAHPAGPGPRHRPLIPASVRNAAILAVIIAALGAPVGVLWWLVSPQTEVTVVAGGVTLSETEAQAFVAADGWFAILTLAAGIICGLVVAFLGGAGGSDGTSGAHGPDGTGRPDGTSRPDGPVAAIGLAAGGALAALIAWRTGVFLGRVPDPIAASASAAVGTILPVSLKLRATGVLLAWAIGALGAFLTAMLASREPPDSRPPADWGDFRAGEPHEVGRGQLDFEAAPPGRDEDGRERES
jgi:hypothetical protein